MNNYEAHWLWYDFANVADSAIMRSKNVDSDDPYINWEKQEQSMRIAALSFACSILETLELKNNDSHTKILFHLRNAVLHNTGNIHNNRGKPKPYQECMKYLSDEKHYPITHKPQPFSRSDKALVVYATQQRAIAQSFLED